MFYFLYEKLKEDVEPVVRAMDNVIDRTNYPLKEQEIEAKNKRRMGLGITALGNTLTLLNIRYGSPEALKFIRKVLSIICNSAYEASSDLAKEKGAFPLFDTDKYLESSTFIKRLPKELKDKIKVNGLRNSHLTSIAPTGTISFCADNISSGLEPTFALEVDRTLLTENGPTNIKLKDYVYNKYSIKGETVDDLDTDDHLSTQIAAQPFIDSAISKTINVGDGVTFEEFKDIYKKAWKGKLKGVTTFRIAGKRYGILNKIEPATKEETNGGSACFFDETGNKSCDQ